MKITRIFYSASAVLLLFAFTLYSQEPWTEKELLAPETLAAQIKSGKDLPVIFSIGPSGTIKNAIEIGSPQDEENLDKFKSALGKLHKSKTVVVYCGCCPFEKCPNIRPAVSLLKDMKFTDVKLLNLPKNLKTDWIDKGFPMND